MQPLAQLAVQGIRGGDGAGTGGTRPGFHVEVVGRPASGDQQVVVRLAAAKSNTRPQVSTASKRTQAPKVMALLDANPGTVPRVTAGCCCCWTY